MRTMPFIPHTEEDVTVMLETIGASSIEMLFDEIPAALRMAELSEMPEGISEMALMRWMAEKAELDKVHLNFIGAGAYEHFIPAEVWDIATRGEFMTAYTPYQAEASQGTLQLLYEYQSMMAHLMNMDVSNASMWDGATALAEAILMASRIKETTSVDKPLSIMVPKTIHPHYRQVLKTILMPLGIQIVEIPYNAATGQIEISVLKEQRKQDQPLKLVALVIPQPNFFGLLEDVHALTDWAHEQDLLVIGVVNPIAMSVFAPPGEWGKTGADIACGEGQPLGVPLASGGPYFGFFCCKKTFIRQMPGRLIGRTHDIEGKMGFTLTLQAREQHIRRAKAKSNICTNQGLLVTAATIYMSLMGPQGLYEVANECHANARALKELLVPLANEGIDILFSKESYFHELILHLPVCVERVVDALSTVGIQAGYILRASYPELGNALLVCVTETKTQEDLMAFVSALKMAVLQEAAVC